MAQQDAESPEKKYQKKRDDAERDSQNYAVN
jgi:hypothetical protein